MTSEDPLSWSFLPMVLVAPEKRTVNIDTRSKVRSGLDRGDVPSFGKSRSVHCISTGSELATFSFQLEISVYLLTSNWFVNLTSLAVSGP